MNRSAISINIHTVVHSFMENYTIFDLKKCVLRITSCSLQYAANICKQEGNSCKQSVREALEEHCSFLLMSMEFRFVFWLFRNVECIFFRRCFSFLFLLHFATSFVFSQVFISIGTFFRIICWMFTTKLWTE